MLAQSCPSLTAGVRVGARHAAGTRSAVHALPEGTVSGSGTGKRWMPAPLECELLAIDDHLCDYLI